MRFRSLNAEPSSDKASTSLKELSISCGLETKGVAAFPAEETQLRRRGILDRYNATAAIPQKLSLATRAQSRTSCA
jgi:hypothetical protein